MRLKNKKLLTLSSFEDASILRKFTILFIITSIVPMTLLYYFYFETTQHGRIGIPAINFTYAMVLMVLGVLIGFIAIRSLLVKVIDISKQNSKALENLLSPETIKELSQGENEIAVLSRSFSAVTKQLESNINELKKKNEELKALDQLKDDFVNNVSHELRLPLTNIQESIRQIAEGMLGEVNEEQLKYCNISLRNIHRLKTLIDNMLDLAKIEKGKLEILKKNVDIGKAINEVLSDFSQRIESKGLEIKADVPPQPMEVWADKDKIFQVLINLVGNAYKFTEKGFIKISVRENGAFIECAVEDSGVGIASKNLPHLFSKFHQIGRWDDSQEKGTGLGLVIAKHIIELHHGQIYVESKEGKGTKFTFTLPKASGEPNGREKRDEKNINSR